MDVDKIFSELKNCKSSTQPTQPTNPTSCTFPQLYDPEKKVCSVLTTSLYDQAARNVATVITSKIKCFIATAVYGNESAPEVETLREIRDNVLMKDKLGKKFVEFYYSGAGEKTAEFIKNDAPFLIPVIRKGLDYVVEKYKE